MKLDEYHIGKWRELGAKERDMRMWIADSEWRELCDLALKGLASVQPEAPPTASALAMESAPTIYEVVMRALRDHYWDSLEPHKALILLHAEGALKWFRGPPTMNRDRNADPA